MAVWLMKSEPDEFGIDDLQKRRNGTGTWDGVRNYQARNFIRAMRPGDEVLFYHSSCPQPGVYGLAEVVSEPYPDPTQFQPKSPYHDPASKREDPRWTVVDVRYVRHLARPVLLDELRAHAGRLKGFRLLERGNRLSVLPVTPAQRDTILALEGA